MSLECPRCGREIEPGSAVDMVFPGPDEDKRIFSGDEILIYHLKCPDGESP